MAFARPERARDLPRAPERGHEHPHGTEETVLVLDEVEVLGASASSERAVLAALSGEGIGPGKTITWPDDVRLDRARELLRSSGSFSYVGFRIEPVSGSRSSVTLHVTVTERATLDVEQLYLGTSAMTPFRGGISLSERDFLGRGFRLGGAAIWGSLPNVERARRQQGYRVYAEAPRIAGAKLGVIAAAYTFSASEPYRVSGPSSDPNPALFRTVDYARTGGLFGLTFPVLPSLNLGIDYRFERVAVFQSLQAARVTEEGRVVDVDLHLEPDRSRLTTLHLGLLYDGRAAESALEAGARFAVDVQLSSPALGSSYEYVKLVAAGAYGFRLPWRHWLTPRVSGGQIAGRAPRFELFFAGDLSDWVPGREQGLIYSTRGPIDVFRQGIDTRVFGVLFARFDLEYAWPVFRRSRTKLVFGGDLVFSAGIFTLAEDRATRSQRRLDGEVVAPWGFNADFGLRLETALGPINLTIGNVLRRTPL